jgi:hypothetical protein
MPRQVSNQVRRGVSDPGKISRNGLRNMSRDANAQFSIYQCRLTAMPAPTHKHTPWKGAAVKNVDKLSGGGANNMLESVRKPNRPILKPNRLALKPNLSGHTDTVAFS